MLVLSRKVNEVIHIGDHITVTVTSIRGDKIRLGIAAPVDIAVLRGEIYHEQRRDARRPDGDDPAS